MIKIKQLNVEERIKLFRRLAIKRNGVVEDNKFHFCIHFPYFTFKHYETLFTVYWDMLQGEASGPYGYAYSAHIAVEFKLKTYFGQAKYLSLIASQSPSVFRKIICKVFRFKSVEVGNPSFDKIFYIHCCDHNFVNQLFNQVIQTKFLGYIDKRPYLFIYKRKLTLSFWNIQEEENEYDRIIDLAINFYNEMKSLGHC